MRNKIIASLFVITALAGATGAAAAQTQDTQTKPNGVTVVNGDALTAPNTPQGAINYAASLTR